MRAVKSGPAGGNAALPSTLTPPVPPPPPPPEWGIDLSSEHERFLAEEVFKGPIIVYDYPTEIKAFYMRQNEDKKTVAAMDILVPRVGELVGGSQREERFDVLQQRIKDAGLPLDNYSWYGCCVCCMTMRPGCWPRLLTASCLVVSGTSTSAALAPCRTPALVSALSAW